MDYRPLAHQSNDAAPGLTHRALNLRTTYLVFPGLFPGAVRASVEGTTSGVAWPAATHRALVTRHCPPPCTTSRRRAVTQVNGLHPLLVVRGNEHRHVTDVGELSCHAPEATALNFLVPSRADTELPHGRLGDHKLPNARTRTASCFLVSAVARH